MKKNKTTVSSIETAMLFGRYDKDLYERVTEKEV